MSKKVKMFKRTIGATAHAAAGPARADGAASPFSGTESIGAMMSECLFDKDLAYAKFARMMRLVEKFAAVLESVIETKQFRICEPTSVFSVAYGDMKKFIATIESALYGSPNIPDDEHMPTLESLGKEKLDTFEAFYDSMRNSIFVRTIVQTCDNLVLYKTSIGDDKALSGGFLEKMPGVSFAPFADFDVKDEYLQTDNVSKRKFILLYLNKVFTIGYKLYQEFIAPEMNVDHMISVVTNAIGQLRREPQLSRCNEAFNMIEKSISMLRDNFGTYYSDYLQSHSPTTIFEHFVLDVAKQKTKTDKREGGTGGTRRRGVAQLSQQFKKIVSFYQEAARRNGKSPEAETLFAQFDRFNSQLGVKNLSGSREQPAQAAAPSAAKPIVVVQGDATPSATAQTSASATSTSTTTTTTTATTAAVEPTTELTAEAPQKSEV